MENYNVNVICFLMAALGVVLLMIGLRLKVPLISPYYALIFPPTLQVALVPVHSLNIAEPLGTGALLFYSSFYLCIWVGLMMNIFQDQKPFVNAEFREGFMCGPVQRCQLLLTLIFWAGLGVQVACFLLTVQQNGGIPLFQMVENADWGQGSDYENFFTPFYTQLQTGFLPVTAFVYGCVSAFDVRRSIFSNYLRQPLMTLGFALTVAMGMGIGVRTNMIIPVMVAVITLLFLRKVSRAFLVSAVLGATVLIVGWAKIGQMRSGRIDEFSIRNPEMLNSTTGTIAAWTQMYLVPNIWNFERFVQGMSGRHQYGAFLVDRTLPGDPMQRLGLRPAQVGIVDSKKFASERYVIYYLTFVPMLYELFIDFGRLGSLAIGLLLGYGMMSLYRKAHLGLGYLSAYCFLLLPACATVAINWFYGMLTAIPLAFSFLVFSRYKAGFGMPKYASGGLAKHAKKGWGRGAPVVSSK